MTWVAYERYALLTRISRLFAAAAVSICPRAAVASVRSTSPEPNWRFSGMSTRSVGAQLSSRACCLSSGARTSPQVRKIIPSSFGVARAVRDGVGEAVGVAFGATVAEGASPLAVGVAEAIVRVAPLSTLLPSAHPAPRIMSDTSNAARTVCTVPRYLPSGTRPTEEVARSLPKVRNGYTGVTPNIVDERPQ